MKIEIELETDENSDIILDPIQLWAAACEAMGLDDQSTGFGYDSYVFRARDKSGRMISEIIIGQ